MVARGGVLSRTDSAAIGTPSVLALGERPSHPVDERRSTDPSYWGRGGAQEACLLDRRPARPGMLRRCPTPASGRSLLQPGAVSASAVTARRRLRSWVIGPCLLRASSG